MVVIRSSNEIILNLIDFFKTAQPNLDTKVGSVARDITIDGPANMVALLYSELANNSNKQSLRLVVGSDLDKLAKNFGLSRKQATSATGVALLTFNSISSSINIDKGSIVTASNGFSFQITSGVSVLSTQLNFYKSLATKYQNDLTFNGITDQYAVQVAVQSTTPGSSGNIPKYALSKTSIPNVSNVLNVSPFIGGNDQEDDATFRNRILSIFSGSSIGTALGYKNTALATTGVADAFVVEPGSPLMTRDGTQVSEDAVGNLTITSEGTGGKVDVVILGQNLVTNTDSFIYKDLSNNNDPTDAKNNFVLGQIAGEANKSFNQKRILDIANSTLPIQPVDSITQVSGTKSGSNFLPMSVDSFGRVSGNYELVKDTSIYQGSPWGFDAIRWVSNKIIFNEDRVKGKFGGQDPTTFSDVIEIPKIQQNISITNENSNVLSSDRSLIQLLHTPASTVTRVFNVNTGERYTIVSQNPNPASGTNLNTSGIIKISGNTLPSQSDVLQVDYNWIITYDQYTDYDGLSLTDNPREVSDSIDWGYSNLVRSEIVNFTQSGSTFQGTLSLPATSIISASTYDQYNGMVTPVSTGAFSGRLAVIINNLVSEPTSVSNVYFENSKTELYDTPENNGAFNVSTLVVGINLQYVATIILPTDSKAIQGDSVSIILNKSDLFNVNNSVGNLNGNQITIPSSNFTTTATNINLDVSYISSVQTFINTGINNLPISRAGNGFALNSSNISNGLRKESQIVSKNLSNQFYVELNLSSLDSSIQNVESIVRLSDGYELWSQDFPGTFSSNTSNNNVQLILSGHNAPATGDRVLVLYSANDLNRFQPFTFASDIVSHGIYQLQENVGSNQYYINFNQFVNESNIKFEILEPNTDLVLATANDGYIDGEEKIFSSLSVNFGSILDIDGNPINITLKKLRVYSSTNNSGIFDILGYSSVANTIYFANAFKKINNSQVSLVRVLDGQELWSSKGQIDVNENILSFPLTTNANPLDLVYLTISNTNNLKQSPTKLAITVSDQVVNTGTLTVVGTTINKATDIVFAAGSSSLQQSLSAALKSAMGLNSNVSLPTNVKLVKIAKLERVSTTNSSSNEVLSVNATYDVIGSQINDNTFYQNSFVRNSSLDNFSFILPSTSNNSTNLNSQGSAGDKFRITFYYSISNDQESVNFTRNGTLYTNKSFALIDRVYVSSGFNNSQSTKVSISSFNQPSTGSRYTSYYNYLAPKQNERIIINYNYNKLIADATFNIEANRPINADILVREAEQVDLDVSMNVVITSQYSASAALVLQNLRDKLIATINSGGLGAYIDSSSLINAAFSVSGIGGARIQYFNKSGKTGTVLSLQAHDDQYFSANTITVNQVAV